MRLVTLEKISELQKNPDNIRNICIVAHVDHGKTTLADSLVATNGIISPRMAGKLRYMDSRKDEQERGITMKSSSISLLHSTGGEEYLVNVVDSPGHVDFSSEVSTAVRLCDGAIVLVDVVEGVCPQTKAALKQAWLENIKPILVLNKMDRLILEMKLSPLDAYIHLTQTLEQVNAVMCELFTTEIFGRTKEPAVSAIGQNTGLYDWDVGLEEADDSNLYFSPEGGNVVFASAVDGWGFCLDDFVQIYSSKLNIDKGTLKQCLWGDFYFNAKAKKILPGAQEKAKKPLFVQFVLENIWALYDTICIRKDKEKLGKMIKMIGVEVSSRDLRHTDTKVQLQAVCSQWLPLAGAVLDMVCKFLPAANRLSEEKVEKLMCSSKLSLNHYPPETQVLKEAFLQCSAEPEAPVIVFISKMFPIERKLLPQNRPQVLTAADLAQRREQARQRLAAKQASQMLEPRPEGEAGKERDEDGVKSAEEDLSEDAFIAFARVYSGIIRPGTSVYVLGPKHDPATALKMIENGLEIEENVAVKDLKPGHHVTKVSLCDIYLLMGRELEPLPQATPGNIIGLGGLNDYVLKSATLSSELACPSFSQLTLMVVPILRVAVETERPADLPALVRGLKLLNQADPCAQVLIQDTGEHVLVTAGEVHLERCLDDLRTRYAKVNVVASEPIIPFRETVVTPPTMDMVNEAIQEQNIQKKETEEDVDADGLVTIQTAGKHSLIQILCVPLPDKVSSLLDQNSLLLKNMYKFLSAKADTLNSIINSVRKMELNEEVIEESKLFQLSEKSLKEIELLRLKLQTVFKEAGGIWSEDGIVDKIWSFGPRRCGPNILINQVEGYHQSVWGQPNVEVLNTSLYQYDSSFINGFQMATLAGPLCEEPMMGVAFVVKTWTLQQSSCGNYGPVSGQIMSAVKEGCKRSFQAQPQRLMTAMYTCNIQANADVLGGTRSLG